MIETIFSEHHYSQNAEREEKPKPQRQLIKDNYDLTTGKKANRDSEMDSILDRVRVLVSMNPTH